MPKGLQKSFAAPSLAALAVRCRMLVCSNPTGQCQLKAVVLAPPLSAPPCGMDMWTLRAGSYARIPAAQAADPEWSHVLADARWQRIDAPLLRHFDTDPAYTVPQERREWLYLPVARR